MSYAQWSPRARFSARSLAVIALLIAVGIAALKTLTNTVVITNTSNQRVARLTLTVGNEQRWKTLFSGSLPPGGQTTIHFVMLYDAHFDAHVINADGSAMDASFGYVAPLLPVRQQIDISSGGLVYQNRVVEM